MLHMPPQRCRSRPVIERCSHIGVAPFAPPPSFAAMSSVLAACALGDADAAAWADSWQQVDDFGWHRAGHSPNWFVVEPTDVTRPPQLDTPHGDEL